MENIYDIIIIGAGPAGLSAGIYGARAKFKVLIIDKNETGGQISLTSEVVNYPGVGKTSGTQLTTTMRKQAGYFGTEFLTATVTEVDFNNDIKIIRTDKGEIRTLGVIIATGANPRTLGFKGEQEFKGRGVAYCATCDGEFFTGLDVFVVGAGFAAAEEAMFLTRYGKKVTIIAREPEFTCAKSIADKVLAHDKIEVRFNTEVLEVGGEVNLKYARFINNVTNEITEYQVEDSKSTFGIFVFAGYVPASGLVKNHVRLNEQGYILTDTDLATNFPGVYAAGDICVKNLRQVVTAVSDGAVAATNLERYVENLRNEYGIVRKDDLPKNSLTKEEFSPTPDNSMERIGDDVDDSFLSSEIKEQLYQIFSKMEKGIKIITILDPSNRLSKEVEGFAKEIDGLTDKVKIEIYKKGENQVLEEEASLNLYPAMLICNESNEYLGAAFHGVPGGHEFNSFIIALYNAAGPGQSLDPALLDELRNFDQKVNIKIAVSLSCTMCPEVVMGAQRIALENKNVTAQMLDLAHYPEIKERYSIMSVPCMIINDESLVFGKKSIEEILNEIRE